jgi:hypothetical protein
MQLFAMASIIKKKLLKIDTLLGLKLEKNYKKGLSNIVNDVDAMKSSS